MGTIAKLIEEAMANSHWGERPNAALMTPAKAKELAGEFSDWVRTSGGSKRSWETDQDYALRQEAETGRAKPGILSLATAYGDVTILTSVYCPPETIYIADEKELRRIVDKTDDLFRGKLELE